MIPLTRARQSLVGVAVAVGLALSVLAPTGPAGAEPDQLSTAKERARRLAAHVERLETRVEIASEQLAGARDELGAVVSQQITANQRLAEVSTTAQSSRAAGNERVRALYMSGGQTGLYATVLDGGSLADVLARVDSVNRVLERDRETAAADARAVAEATALQSSLTQLSSRQTDLEQAARAAEDDLRTLLQTQQQALSDAGAQVRQLTEEWRAAQAAAAARRAAIALGVSGPRPTNLPDAGSVPGAALQAADAVRGAPYVWAATGPDSFDCSGLTQWAYAHAGLALPRTSREQWWVGPHPSLADLQPGDLLFWATDTSNPSTIHHVALYAGSGWMIHAPRTGDVVRYARVYLDGYIGATRPAAATG